MRIQILHPSYLKLTHAVMVLSAVAGMRDGLTISTDPQGGAHTRTLLSGLILENRNAGTEIDELGNIVLKEGDLPSEDPLFGLAVQRVLLAAPTGADMELILLKDGSTEGVIKDLIKERIGKLFRILTSATDLLKGSTGTEFVKTTKQIVEESNAPDSARRTAAGQIAAGGLVLRSVLAVTNATALNITKTDEDQIEMMTMSAQSK